MIAVAAASCAECGRALSGDFGGMSFGGLCAVCEMREWAQARASGCAPQPGRGGQRFCAFYVRGSRCRRCPMNQGNQER